MTDKINLLISDENRLFREGLKLILSSRKIEIVGEVRSLAEAIELLRSQDEKPTILLCDPSADTEAEFITMREITHEFRDLKVVVMSERIAAPWLETAVSAGASGFLPKDISADALRFSLELVQLGEQIFPMFHSLLDPRQYAPAVPAMISAMAKSRAVSLSERESQILGCLISGLPNKTIARNLNMAEATVKVHLKTLLRKINVQNRTQAAIWGINSGSLAYTSGPPACGQPAEERTGWA
ncbi:MAG: two-component response regulator [Rhodospirillales bacterium]|nr:two-component response regulator [Rhodospirillales bacterium]